MLHDPDAQLTPRHLRTAAALHEAYMRGKADMNAS